MNATTKELGENLNELDSKIRSAIAREDFVSFRLLKAEHERLYAQWYKSLSAR